MDLLNILTTDSVSGAVICQTDAICCIVSKRPLFSARLPVKPSIDLNSGIDRVLSSLNEARVHEGKKRMGRDVPAVSDWSIWQMSLAESKALAAALARYCRPN